MIQSQADAVDAAADLCQWAKKNLNHDSHAAIRIRKAHFLLQNLTSSDWRAVEPEPEREKTNSPDDSIVSGELAD